MLPKKNILAIIIVLLLAITAGWYWWTNKIKAGDKAINLDNPEHLFNVIAPADFDDNKKERLAEKLKQAKVLYEENKNDNWARVVLGNIREFIRDYDSAILLYEKALELNKSAITVALSLADIYERQKQDYSLAEEYYQKALEIDPTKPYIYISLAKLYEFKLNQLENSEGTYLQGLKRLENEPELLVNLIEFYRRTNNPTKAEEYAKKLLTLYPDNTNYQKDFSGLVK